MFRRRSKKLSIDLGDGPVDERVVERSWSCVSSIDPDTVDTVRIFISAKLRGRKELLKGAIAALEAMPEALRAPLDTLYVAGHYGKTGPNPEAGAHLGTAIAGLGLVVLFRSPALGGRPDLRPFLLAHELAHLHHQTGGPPEFMRISNRWPSARQRDVSVSRQAAIDAWGNAEPFTDMLFGQPWITPYAAVDQRDVEDWAEAMGLFVCDLNGGWLAERAGQKLRFGDLYPNRAQLLGHYLLLDAPKAKPIRFTEEDLAFIRQCSRQCI